ncbi:MAG TPA: hypothetical protein VHE35_13915 [Kofleriaceae bacterium]|nr:hypothetical protein [Kofleriaceae bacterium]
MTLTFRDILVARELGPEACNRAALAFSIQQVAHASVGSWVMVATGTPPAGHDREAFARLRRAARAAGLGVIRLLARWMADDGGEATASIACVPGADLQAAVRLRDACAESVTLFAGPETDGALALLARNGGLQTVGPAVADNIIAAVAGAAKPGWTLLGFDYPAQTFVEGLIATSHESASLAQGDAR